jgi:hypothetical protein
MGERVLVGEPEGGRPFGKPRSIWEDNIKNNLKNMMRAWTGLIWPRIRAVVNMVMNRCVS